MKRPYPLFRRDQRMQFSWLKARKKTKASDSIGFQAGIRSRSGAQVILMGDITVLTPTLGLSTFQIPETYIRATRRWLLRKHPEHAKVLNLEIGNTIAKAFLLDCLWSIGIDIFALQKASMEENEALISRTIWSALSRGYDQTAVRLFLIKRLDVVQRSLFSR